MRNLLTVKLWVSLNAALPFSQDGQHPVYEWRASLSCCHFLGLLFRNLVQVHRGQEEGQEEAESSGEVAPPPVLQPRAETVSRVSAHCQRRRTLKRHKHVKRPKSEPRPILGIRGGEKVQEEEEEEVLREAAEKLQTICSDFQSSLKYKELPGVEDASLSSPSSCPGDLRTRITLRSLEMISVQRKSPVTPLL